MNFIVHLANIYNLLDKWGFLSLCVFVICVFYVAWFIWFKITCTYRLMKTAWHCSRIPYIFNLNLFVKKNQSFINKSVMSTSQLWMIWTVQWTIGIVITGVKQATVYPHATTLQLSPTRLYTSTQWDHVFSNTQTPAQTLCIVLNWTIKTNIQAGKIC